MPDTKIVLQIRKTGSEFPDGMAMAITEWRWRRHGAHQHTRQGIRSKPVGSPRFPRKLQLKREISRKIGRTSAIETPIPRSFESKEKKTYLTHKQQESELPLHTMKHGRPRQGFRHPRSAPTAHHPNEHLSSTPSTPLQPFPNLPGCPMSIGPKGQP